MLQKLGEWWTVSAGQFWDHNPRSAKQGGNGKSGFVGLNEPRKLKSGELQVAFSEHCGQLLHSAGSLSLSSVSIYYLQIWLALFAIQTILVEHQAYFRAQIDQELSVHSPIECVSIIFLLLLLFFLFVPSDQSSLNLNCCVGSQGLNPPAVQVVNFPLLTFQPPCYAPPSPCTSAAIVPWQHRAGTVELYQCGTTSKQSCAL